MKVILISIFISCYFISGFGQENTYNTENQNYYEWKTDSSIINKHYEKGAINLKYDLAKNINYPSEAIELCSQALVLFECTVLKDTILINFNNEIGLGFESSIINVFNQNREKWKNIPEKGLRFKYSVSFIIKVPNDLPTDINKDSVCFNIIMSRNVNCLIYHTDNLYEGCYFPSNELLIEKFKDYKAGNEIDSLKVIKEEIKRRDPLMKHFDIETYE
ncbi:MAG: hypothetical protein K9I29_08795 [Bacteroidales bacterium]|nr:hypothetical protein [Bacteroidales bacterium]MCF8328376.1 hypothetical protein [Bacteroidales bacterium]